MRGNPTTEHVRFIISFIFIFTNIQDSSNIFSGNEGPPGNDGRDGFDGATGAKGDKGTPGEVGATGEDGVGKSLRGYNITTRLRNF